MGATVQDLVFVLDTFFPAHLKLETAFYVLAVIASLIPLWQLHLNQRRGPRQPIETAWSRAIVSLLSAAFRSGIEEGMPDLWAEERAQYAKEMGGNLGALCDLLGLDTTNILPQNALSSPTIHVLCTTRLNCMFCIPDPFHPRTLRRREKYQHIHILDRSFQWMQAELVIAHCPSCRSDYYPDRVTYRAGDGSRRQHLECNTPYLRISKHGIWAHRQVAIAQEKAVVRFHSGWSNFADWINESLGDDNAKITHRQSQRLFLEHFSRRLLILHHHHETFSSPANPSSQDLSEAIRDLIGQDGGRIDDALQHACADCTHTKRYRIDLINEGADLAGPAHQVADRDIDVPNVPELAEGADVEGAALNAALPQQPAQQGTPPDGEARGYVRMTVMDGKTIKHRICSLSDCEKPLMNYRDGRFCYDHRNYALICGIIPCGQPIESSGALTCANPTHQAWYKHWKDRFTRLSFPGVQRVVRRQNMAEERGIVANPLAPTLRVQLPPLDDIQGEHVVHTFRARSIYCVQTVQWACGMPIGWGKCYKAESLPQVVAILDNIWFNNPHLRPSFIAYDDACDLLRHIVTQDAHSDWLTSTKFVVDAWHYIGHRATDVLCRLWCNPAPTDGSQPDLVMIETDDLGEKHSTRAFNTETAEQFNSWLNGFESQLRQMTDKNFDFFMHVLFMLFKERIEDRIAKKERDLPEAFWEEVV